MRKVGIMGGTFNPIHNGHVRLAQLAYEQLDLDSVLFIPSGISYMKRDISILDGENRLQLVKLATDQYPYFEVSDMELKRCGNTYTIDTLHELLSQNKNTDYYFIIGDDTLFTMEKWYHVDEIFACCNIVVCIRDCFNQSAIQDKIQYLEQKFQAKIYALNAEAYKVSSSDIRSRIQQGLDCSDMLDLKVNQYIVEHHLYTGE